MQFTTENSTRSRMLDVFGTCPDTWFSVTQLGELLKIKRDIAQSACFRLRKDRLLDLRYVPGPVTGRMGVYRKALKPFVCPSIRFLSRKDELHTPTAKPIWLIKN